MQQNLNSGSAHAQILFAECQRFVMLRKGWLNQSTKIIHHQFIILELGGEEPCSQSPIQK